MIITNIFNGVLIVVQWIIDLFPNTNALIDWQSSAFGTFNDLIFENLGLIDIIAPIGLLKALLGGIITMIILKYTITLVLWIIKKIPLASIE